MTGVASVRPKDVCAIRPSYSKLVLQEHDTNYTDFVALVSTCSAFRCSGSVK